MPTYETNEPAPSAPQADSAEQLDDLSLKDTLLLFKDSAVTYFNARKELVTIEAKEAAQLLVKKVMHAVVLIFCLLLFYLLTLVVAVTAGGLLLDPHVNGYGSAIIAAVLAVIHLVVALVFISKLKKKMSIFEMTKAELNNEKQWIKEIK